MSCGVVGQRTSSDQTRRAAKVVHIHVV
jgi:hypothetical protein